MYYSVDKSQSGAGDNSSQTKNNVSREGELTNDIFLFLDHTFVRIFFLL